MQSFSASPKGLLPVWKLLSLKWKTQTIITFEFVVCNYVICLAYEVNVYCIFAWKSAFEWQHLRNIILLYFDEYIFLENMVTSFDENNISVNL